VTDGDLEVRLPTPEDLPAIGELYRAVKGRGRPESVTRHRFFDTPWGDSPAYVAFDGDKCVSMVLFWPVALRVGDEVVLGGQGTDGATHPDYRNRPRLFVGMVRAGFQLMEERGFDVYYTFPNTRSIKILKVVAGTYVGEVGAWGLELGSRRGMGFLRRRWRGVGDLSVAGTPPPDLAVLIEEALGDEPVIRVDKSRTWLEWRYSPATAERYEWLLMHEGGSMVAAALVGERDTALWGPDFAGLCRIHELFALSEDAGEALLRRVIAHVEQRPGARKLDVLVKDPRLERAVERAGFARETTRPITSIVFREGLQLDPYDFSHWRIISGDMDFF
jgi:Acetyltransferase (GNAT) domain